MAKKKVNAERGRRKRPQRGTMGVPSPPMWELGDQVSIIPTPYYDKIGMSNKVGTVENIIPGRWGSSIHQVGLRMEDGSIQFFAANVVKKVDDKPG
jgi:hypothetical protein